MKSMRIGERFREMFKQRGLDPEWRLQPPLMATKTTTPGRFMCAVLMTCLIASVHAQAQTNPTASPTTHPTFHAWAPTPPMGWNSWDCFGAGVNEQQTLENADYMAAKLKSHGWTLITVDIQWYEPLAHTTGYRKNATLEMDEFGRLLPAANRFPSTKDSRSFKPLADSIHSRGLKFGVHLLRGIPRQAVEKNTPVLNTSFHAADVADTQSVCQWNTDMYGVDMTRPGAQAYYDSVFALLASWEIDFVKVDDLSRPYHTAEIEAIRQAIDKTGRPIVLSTSPGDTPLAQGAHVQDHANMWRISDDFWDSWHALQEQFKRLDDWTPYRGPGHFPDADMLPLGNIRAWSTKGAWTHFTHDEQTTMMTLWCIARSPLIVGANLPKNDEFTESLLTNDEVLQVDQNSTNNRQAFRGGDLVVWMADVPGSADKYVAMFNAPPAPPKGAATTAPDQAASAMIVRLSDLGITGGVTVRDLWSHRELGIQRDTITATIAPHAAVMYRLTPAAP